MGLKETILISTSIPGLLKAQENHDFGIIRMKYMNLDLKPKFHLVSFLMTASYHFKTLQICIIEVKTSEGPLIVVREAVS